MIINFQHNVTLNLAVPPRNLPHLRETTYLPQFLCFVLKSETELRQSMATDIQAWCRETKSAKWTDDREVEILESYLEETLTASEAAEELTAYIDRNKTLETKIGRIWTLIQLCAVNCADLHELMVQLIKAIIASAPSKRTGGVDWTKQETSFKELWRDSYDCEFNLDFRSNISDWSIVDIRCLLF